MKVETLRFIVCCGLVLAVAGSAWGAAVDRGQPVHSIDAEFERINDRVPGFGGMFYDEGRLMVYMTEPGDHAFFKAYGDDVTFLRGRFEFRELQGWRLELRSILGHPGITSLDVDEGVNRIDIGIEPELKRRTARRIRRELRARGIPRRAVRFSARRAMIPLQTTVQDAFNPIPGGVQINFPGFLCTLGFNVQLGGHCYFITNDHCSATSGVTEGTRYGQPLLSTNNFAQEIFDPPFFTGAGCFPGQRCRYSDATAARYDNPSECEFGEIARTAPVSNPPAIFLDLDNPDRWSIVSKQLSPLQGQYVAKQGRTTGRTEGRVQATCQDTGVSGENIVRLCQATVTNNGQVVVQSGDSGSPVFRRRLDSSVAQLVGILWGGNGPGTEFVYSPMEGVETDFNRSLPVF